MSKQNCRRVNVEVSTFCIEKESKKVARETSWLPGKLLNTIYLSSKICRKLMWHVKTDVSLKRTCNNVSRLTLICFSINDKGNGSLLKIHTADLSIEIYIERLSIPTLNDCSKRELYQIVSPNAFYFVFRIWYWISGNTGLEVFYINNYKINISLLKLYTSELTLLKCKDFFDNLRV